MKGRVVMVTANGLTCRELVALVTDYLENALSDADRMRFEDHLAGCAGCTRHLAQMRLTIAATGLLREDDLSAMARDDLLAAFRTWKQHRSER
jgi:hypothetical protein